MRTNGKKYYVRDSVIVGLGSLIAYLLFVFFGVYLAWDRAFKNGQPAGAGLTTTDRQAASLLYRNTFLTWMLAFALLCVLLYLVYWRLGKPPHSSTAKLKREAAATRLASISLALSFLSAYARTMFVSRTVLVFDVLMWVFAGWFAIGFVILAIQAGNRITKYWQRQNPASTANRPSKRRGDTTSKKSTLSRIISRCLTVANQLLDVLGVLIPALFGFPELPAWLDGIQQLFVRPEPFALQIPYDNTLWVVPLIGFILFLLNLKFNAHPEVASVLGSGARYTATLYTMGRKTAPATEEPDEP